MNKAALLNPNNRQSVFPCHAFSEMQQVLNEIYSDYEVSALFPEAETDSTIKVSHLYKAKLLQITLAGELTLNSCGEGVTHLSYIHVIEGQIRIQLDNHVEYTIGSGQVIIITPGSEVSASTSHHCVWYEIRISQCDIKNLMATWFGFDDKSALQYTVVPDTQDPRIIAGMNTIQSMLNYIEQFEELKQAPLALESLESALCMTLIFSFSQQRDVCFVEADGSVGLQRVEMIEQYIRDHASEAIDINQLANVARCSPASLYRAYKKYRKNTPMIYLQQIRLQKSRQMLLQANHRTTVSYVATRSGFSHLGRFSKAYKQEFNENPSMTLQRAQGRG
ncbi:MAG: AraC family transcriptional regulator [Reinekea sp.]